MPETKIPQLAAPTMEQVRSVAPALEKYTQGPLFSEVWKRPGLSPRDRSIATITALTVHNHLMAMPFHFGFALDNGVKPSEVSEIITHLAFYAGWPNAMSAVSVVKDIFAQRGIGIDQLPTVSPKLVPMSDALPDENVRVAFFTQSNLASVSEALVKYTDDLLYHEVWLRPGLAPRDRDLVTVSSLIAAGSMQFLPFYLNRALMHGLSKTEISELLAHLAFYSGWANSISAAVAINDVFANQPK
jgi:4-carboxymuconolactone decarboxylase